MGKHLKEKQLNIYDLSYSFWVNSSCERVKTEQRQHQKEPLQYQQPFQYLLVLFTPNLRED